MAEEIVQKLYRTRMTDDHIREATYQARAVEANKNMPHIPYTREKAGYYTSWSMGRR
jgi:hypothetical protein